MAYVLACSKIWIPDLHARLSQKIGDEFLLVTNPTDLSLTRLKAINPKKIFFAHWSSLIPSEIHEAFECIIFHMTDLPFGRGGSPLQNLISAGFTQTKITALRCEKTLDTGPIYLKKSLSLLGSAQEIYVRATHLIGDMITEIIETEPTPTAQQGEATVFKRRTPEQSALPPQGSPNELYDFIRMLDAEGYPRAFIDLENYRLEFSMAHYDGTQLRAQVVFKPKGTSS